MAVSFMAVLFATVLSPLWVRQANAAVSNFAAGSFWNTAIPSYTSLHPSSAALVQDVQRQVSSYGSGFNTAAPVYVAEAGAATVSVIPWDCGSGILPDLINQWQAVPIPFFAVPGANEEMIIHQPSTATTWEFGHMRNISGQWQACTGGRVSTASDGVFSSPYGVSSSGLAALGGQMSISELKAADINHAIGLTLPQTNSSTWPATQSAGSVAGAPPMGMRFRLDPSVSVSSLGLSSLGAAIARAAQTYGFVVWDGGSTVSVSGESPVSYTTRGLPNPYNSIGASSALTGFPWDKLQAMPTDYGQSVDVPAITQFSSSSVAISNNTSVTLTWQATNVTMCTIPGLVDNLPASGSTQTSLLKVSTVFVLRCGGPNGTASSQVHIQVSQPNTDSPAPSLTPGITIETPYSGYANILTDLMSAEAAQQVYKVVYYDQEDYLYDTAKPPFALNTSRMENGKHTIKARIYYRDGRTEEKTAGITVNNSPEILFATTQSTLIKAPPTIPRVWSIVGLVLVLGVMVIGGWWGWRRAHLV